MYVQQIEPYALVVHPPLILYVKLYTIEHLCHGSAGSPLALIVGWSLCLMIVLLFALSAPLLLISVELAVDESQKMLQAYGVFLDQGVRYTSQKSAWEIALCLLQLVCTCCK